MTTANNCRRVRIQVHLIRAVRRSRATGHVNDRLRFALGEDDHFNLRVDGLAAVFKFGHEQSHVAKDVVVGAFRSRRRVGRHEQALGRFPRPFAHQISAGELHFRVDWLGCPGVNLARVTVIDVEHLVLRVLVGRVELRFLAHGASTF